MSDQVENYDDVTMYGLSPEKMDKLLLAQNELTFIWANKNGHPLGVTMSYIWRNGSIWCTATEQRARMKALARGPALQRGHLQRRCGRKNQPVHHL